MKKLEDSQQVKTEIKENLIHAKQISHLSEQTAPDFERPQCHK